MIGGAYHKCINPSEWSLVLWDTGANNLLYTQDKLKAIQRYRGVKHGLVNLREYKGRVYGQWKQGT